MDKEFFEEFKESTLAKLRLYREYIVRYLKVLSKSYKRYGKGKDVVYMADLFAGAGTDFNDNQGSPLILADFLSNTDLEGMRVNALFNELDKNNFEKLKNRIDGHPIKKNKFSKCDVVNYDYETLLPKIKEKHKNHNFYKRFFFIDPFGYKGTHLKDMLDLLNDGNTEILLFVPVSFIYRFRGKKDLYKAIENFLNEFSIELNDNINNISFINNMVNTLRERTKYYVDSFIIEDNLQKGYNCLLFFSNNKKGFEKFIEAKWEIVPHQGNVFKHTYGQEDFFGIIDKEDLVRRILAFLQNGEKTNVDIRNFCYEQEYLPKHGNEALKTLLQDDKIFVKVYNENDTIRKNCFYLAKDKELKVIVGLKK